MAVVATKSYEDYEKEQIDKAQKYVNEQAAARKQVDAQTMSQIGAAIDKSANTAAGVYQKRIDGADAAYKSQYADNAIDEAFSRNQIKNSMAASGMTDSGQNLTMQTALSLQRNNRDATVTENKRNYVQEMQDAIDAVWADAASQKATQEITAQQNYQTFYDNLYANAMSGARENAVNLYNADLTAQAEAEAAEQDRLAREAEARVETTIEANSARAEYANHLMKNMDYTEDQAWAAAYRKYPSDNQEVNNYATSYTFATKNGYSEQEAAIYADAGGGEAGEAAVADLASQKAVSITNGAKLKLKGGLFSSTTWSSATDDGKKVAQVVTNNVTNLEKYKALTPYQQEAAKIRAIAICVSESWDGDGDTEKNKTRLAEAARQLGVSAEDVQAVYENLTSKKVGAKSNGAV